MWTGASHYLDGFFHRSDDESCDDEDDDNGEYSTMSSPTGHSSSGTKRRSKPRNGKHPTHVDMTPPDKLLKKSERKATKYAKNKKRVSGPNFSSRVSSFIFLA